MQPLRYLLPSAMAVVMTVFGAVTYPGVGLAQPALVVTERDITGAIIATQEDRVSVGEGDTVILDQGQARGVMLGDRFAIFEDVRTVVHPLNGRLIRVAPEVIGELEVVYVHTQTSTALLINSKREVNTGAPIASLRLAALRQQESRTETIETRTQVDMRQARLSPCLETTRQAIREAESAGLQAPELAEAKSILARVDIAVEQANTLLTAGEVERATNRLDSALADCLQAEELLRRTAGVTVRRAPAVQPERYMVQRGDTLWGISGREQIYHNPLMWPLIYKANSQQIRDPDLIFPRQIFVIPRDYTPAEAAAAIQRARQRATWRLRDGR
jgi:LysM repeat protein